MNVVLAYRMPHQSIATLIPVARNKPKETWEQAYVRACQWAKLLSRDDLEYEARIYDD